MIGSKVTNKLTFCHCNKNLDSQDSFHKSDSDETCFGRGEVRQQPAPVLDHHNIVEENFVCQISICHDVARCPLLAKLVEHLQFS